MDLITGNPEIDLDHTQITQAFQDLSDSEVYTNIIPRLNMVNRFLDYATNHLCREEKLMRRVDYPDYHAHIEAHRHLQEDLLGILKQILDGTTPHEIVLQNFKRIFIDHCEEFDKPLASWMEAHPPKARKH